MITLQYVFWILILLFAIIGAMRGWAKELLVTCAVIVGLFIIAIMQRFAPEALRVFLLGTGKIQFWINTLIILFLAMFGYQTPNLARIPQGRFVREKFSDALLGFFIGALNGYLILGSVWYFMDIANYPFAPNITAPPTNLAILNYLPPELLIANNSPVIYFAVAISFIFVLVVFI